MDAVTKKKPVRIFFYFYFAFQNAIEQITVNVHRQWHATGSTESNKSKACKKADEIFWRRSTADEAIFEKIRL
jgi:hypothetical protein